VAPPSQPGSNDDIRERIAKLEISAPTDFVHENHTEFLTPKGEYEGLPPEWRDSKELSALSFGSSITQQPRVLLEGYKERIPTILLLMGRDLRRRNGFVSEGLFRISASRAEQNRVRTLLGEASSEGNTMKALTSCEDAHVIGALIKEWCRMLKHSILEELDFQALAQLTTESLEDGQTPSPAFVQVYYDFLHGSAFLSETRRSVFLWLLDLMRVVIANKEVNRMGVRAIATCFAPSLFVLNDPNANPTESIQQIKLATSTIVNALCFLESHDSSTAERDLFADRHDAFVSL
jgi:hypothetical protein